MKDKNKVRLVLCTTYLAVSAAYAQEASQSTGPALQTVTITAEKRSGNVQSTPMSVSVLSGDALSAQGIDSVRDLGEAIVGVKVQSAGTAAVFVRGIGSSNSSTTGDQGVAMNVDGIFMSRSDGLWGSLFDIARVEVLKGAQGTLYGRGSLGGNVNVVTNAPKRRFEGAASVELGNYSLVQTSGMVNTPLNDELAVRVAFRSQKHTGYQSNGTDDADSSGARVRMQWNPSDDVSVGLNASTYEEGGKGYGAKPLVPIGSHPAAPGWDNWIDASGGRRDLTLRTVSLPVEWTTGYGTVVYLPGFVHSDNRSLNPQLTGNTVSPGQSFVDSRQATHELRMTSSSGTPLQWLGGLFYMKENADYTVFGFTGHFTNTSKAAFGQLSYRLDSGLTLLAGARRTTDDKEQRPNATARYVNSWTINSGKLGLEYEFDRQHMVYGTVANGYKPGGFFTVPAGRTDNNYQPEKSVSFEAGSKNRLLDSRLQVNAAVFYTDFRSYQANQQRPGGVFAVINAGRARSGGVDIETQFRMTERDRIDASFEFLRARFGSFIVPASQVPAGDYSGQRMPFAPQLSGNLSYERNQPLSGGGTLRARLGVHAESASYLNIVHDALTRQAGYMRSEGSLGYDAAEGRYSVNLWVRNIENRLRYASVQNSPFESATLQAPRTFGVSLNAHL